MRAVYLAILAMLLIAAAPAATVPSGVADRRDPELAVPHGARTIAASPERGGDPVRLAPFAIAVAPVVIPPPPIVAAPAHATAAVRPVPDVIAPRSRAPPTRRASRPS